MWDVAEEGGVAEIRIYRVHVIQDLVFNVAIEHVIIFVAEVCRLQMRQDDGANSVDEVLVEVVHPQNLFRDDGTGFVVD